MGRDIPCDPKIAAILVEPRGRFSNTAFVCR